MRRLIIGSTAAVFHIEGFRDPKDLDVLADHSIRPDEERYWHDAFCDWLPNGTARIATLDELYTIKLSHSGWDLGGGSWEKHMYDASVFKGYGAKLDFDLYVLLKSVWTEKHGGKRVDLTKDADAFFTDGIKRIYVHDSVHESVAYGDRPLYESFLKPDGGGVDMDMAAVWAAPLDTQVRLFREEIYATALERSVIPSDYTISPRLAYARALKKTVVSLTKGRSSRFIVENYDTFRRPDIDYVAHHKSKAHKLVRT